LKEAHNVTNNSRPNSVDLINTTSFQSNAQNYVSIVPDASTLDDRGFQPNPIKVKVGQAIKWTNNDTIPHTITSGIEGAASTGSDFDSGNIDIRKSFDHKFVTKGEFPYFCRIHPNMVGEVDVSD